MAGPTGTLGTIPTLTIGGYVFADTSTLIQVFGSVTGGGQRSTFRKLDGSAGYAPSGVTFKPKAAICWITITAAVAQSGGFTLVYHDNDTGFASNSTALTNAVYVCGSSAAQLVNSNAQGKLEVPLVGWSIPAGKYHSVEAGTSTTSGVHVFGYEV